MSDRIYSSKVHNATKIENVEIENASWTNNIYCMTITFGSYVTCTMRRFRSKNTHPSAYEKMSMYLQCFVNKIRMIHRSVKKVEIRN